MRGSNLQVVGGRAKVAVAVKGRRERRTNKENEMSLAGHGRPWLRRAQAGLALATAGTLVFVVGLATRPPTVQAVCFHSQQYDFETRRYEGVEPRDTTECWSYSDPNTRSQEVIRGPQ